MNPDHRATFAYVMNKMGPGTTGTDRTNRYRTLIYEALGLTARREPVGARRRPERAQILAR